MAVVELKTLGLSGFEKKYGKTPDYDEFVEQVKDKMATVMGPNPDVVFGPES